MTTEIHIKTHIDQGVYICNCTGEFDETNVDEKFQIIRDFIGDIHTPKFVVLDMQKVSYVNSKFIWLLADLSNQLDKKQGRLYISGATEIYDTLDIVGITEFIRIFDDLSEAKWYIFDNYSEYLNEALKGDENKVVFDEIEDEEDSGELDMFVNKETSEEIEQPEKTSDTDVSSKKETTAPVEEVVEQETKSVPSAETEQSMDIFSSKKEESPVIDIDENMAKEENKELVDIFSKPEEDLVPEMNNIQDEVTEEKPEELVDIFSTSQEEDISPESEKKDIDKEDQISNEKNEKQELVDIFWAPNEDVLEKKIKEDITIEQVETEEPIDNDIEEELSEPVVEIKEEETTTTEEIKEEEGSDFEDILVQDEPYVDVASIETRLTQIHEEIDALQKEGKTLWKKKQELSN